MILPMAGEAAFEAGFGAGVSTSMAEVGWMAVGPAVGAGENVAAAGEVASPVRCATMPARYPLNQISSSRDAPVINSCTKVNLGEFSIEKSFEMLRAWTASMSQAWTASMSQARTASMFQALSAENKVMSALLWRAARRNWFVRRLLCR